MGSVDNERRFSRMNNSVTTIRSRIEDAHLNVCVRVASAKSHMNYKTFPFERAIKLWSEKKDRRLTGC